MRRPVHSPRRLAAAFVAAALAAGCASGPKPPAGGGAVGGGRVTTWPDRDGPEASPPPGLMNVPDALPRVEMIRTGGPNKPYEVFGRNYVPATADVPFRESGLASWYGRKFHGRPTASGELYDMYAMTAAHPTLPIPSFARVRNPSNGREVIVRINDRGPFHGARSIDLSYTAALKLGVLRGVAPVEIERLTHDDIRSGRWRRDGVDAPASGDDTVLAFARPAAEAPAAADAAAAAPPATPGVVTTAAAAATDGAGAGAAVSAPTPAESTAAAATLPITQETTPAKIPGAVGFWVQLGAFRGHDGAVSLRRHVAERFELLGPLLTIFNEGALHRLQAGPYRSRDDAAQVAQRLRELMPLSPVIVQRR